jgi:hypothetical protein
MGLGEKLIAAGKGGARKLALAAGLVAAAPLLGAGCNCGPDLGNIVEGTKGAASDVINGGKAVGELAGQTFDEAKCNYAEDGGTLDASATKAKLEKAATLLEKVSEKMTSMGGTLEVACRRHISPGQFEIDGELVGTTDNVQSVTSQKNYRDRDAEVILPAGAAGQDVPDWNRGLYFAVEEYTTTGNENSAISLKLNDNQSVAVGINGNFKKVGAGEIRLVVKETKVTYNKENQRQTTVTTYIFDLRTNGGQITEVTQAYIYDGADNNVCSPGSGFVVENNSQIQASVVKMLNSIPAFADKLSDKMSACR